ncbi:MAG TPA: hypothetical protein VNK52_09745 [Hyphomicrobiaceae bacterium]|nr:hypothetical protein [Hyphomicrobiaceae bacterium]
MVDDPRLTDGSARLDAGLAAADGRTGPANAPALRTSTELTAGPPAGGGLVIGSAAFMVLVFLQTFLLVATAVALTLVVARPDLLHQFTNAAAIGTAAGPWSGDVAPGERGAASRLVLDLPRPIQIVAGQASNLGFRLLPPGEFRGTLVLTIRGLPDGSVISGARKLGADTWSLDAGRETALNLTVPSSVQGPFELEIGLRRPDGTLVASEITSLIALPEGRTSRDPERDAMAALLLLESARTFLKAGDVRSARVLLQSAAQRGNAQAAFELAQTFDQSAGVGSDAPRAMYWYMEAKRLGHPDAEAHFATLVKRSPQREAPGK